MGCLQSTHNVELKQRALRVIETGSFFKVGAIIFSGNMGHDEIEKSLKAGACGYFTKPFEIAELRNY